MTQRLSGPVTNQVPALTCVALQTLHIEDNEAATARAHDPAILEGLYRIGDRGTVGAQHQPQQFMRERQRVVLRAIVHLEQPSCQPLFDAMKAVADCGLRDGGKIQIGVFEQRVEKGMAWRDCGAQKCLARYANGVAGELDDHVKRIGDLA